MSGKTWFTLTAAYALFQAGPALAQHQHGMPGMARDSSHAEHAAPEAKPNYGVRTIEIGVISSGFDPAELRLRKGEVVKLVFTRTAERTCATRVIIKDLGVDADLSLNQPVAVTVKPDKAGKLRYSCPMDMIGGTLIVD